MMGLLCSNDTSWGAAGPWSCSFSPPPRDVVSPREMGGVSMSRWKTPKEPRGWPLGTTLLRRDLRRVSECEGLRHLAWKDSRLLNSWNLSRFVAGRVVCLGAGLFRAGVLSPGLRMGSRDHPKIVQNCAWGVARLSSDFKSRIQNRSRNVE